MGRRGSAGGTPRGGSHRRGTVQGVNTLLLVVLVGVLLYFIARTQVDEPITWLIRRVQTAIGM